MEKKQKRNPIAVCCSMLGTVILVMVILLCIPFTVPKVFGYQAYTVISGSMEPNIPIGSLVYIKQVDPKAVQADDVIAFYGGRDRTTIITHRVVENQVSSGEFVTKGDANPAVDINPVSYHQLIGLVEIAVPKLGGIAQLLTGATGKITAGCMIGLAIVLNLLGSVIDTDKSRRK